MMTDVSRIKEDITRKYGSLVQPNYSFVSRVVEAVPYSDVIRTLSENFKIEETTDLNEDVSFCYLLSKSGSRWLLQLSMIGRYFVLLRLEKDGTVEVVNPTRPSGNAEDILDCLMRFKFIGLDQETLETSLNMNLYNTEPDDVCLFNALFSDLEILPWNVVKE